MKKLKDKVKYKGRTIMVAGVRCQIVAESKNHVTASPYGIHGGKRTMLTVSKKSLDGNDRNIKFIS